MAEWTATDPASTPPALREILVTLPSTPPASPRPYSEVDLSSRAFWDRTFDEREQSFAALRRGELSWHQPFDAPFPHAETGFWAATRLEDITFVSRRPEIFSSAEGIAISPLPKQIQEMTAFFLMMDPPEHTTFRRLISEAFTPRQVARVQSQIAAGAEEIVDGLVGAGSVDFVTACSGILPMRTVSDMIGIAPGDREAVRHAAEALFAGPSPAERAAGVDPLGFMLSQIELLRTAAIEIARHRREHPADDLMTNIVQAEVDGHRLTDEQIGAFMILLSSAGNDTTKQTTSHTILALSRHPEQKQWLMADWDGRIGRAVEEFVRWGTPVMDFARTAVVDTEIRGTPVLAGEKVALFYCSGNRDETVFERPHDFDLARTPNPHVGFGGGGVHYCLGHSVAKSQLRNLFQQLLTRIPDIEIGEPEWLPNTFVHGIERLPAYIP
ncbi:Cytochrome P450 [Trujillonella endophytica]|uniref:Cytochrome P450 n=1 Tax=Trujillonella endophytica TaxID=673521 RepID=A0A1H8T678_9ACTN|nr:Cytochrome P450 [Trujillella endophytica]